MIGNGVSSLSVAWVSDGACISAVIVNGNYAPNANVKIRAYDDVFSRASGLNQLKNNTLFSYMQEELHCAAFEVLEGRKYRAKGMNPVTNCSAIAGQEIKVHRPS